MRRLRKPTIVVFCGWPLSGKTEIASLVACELGIRLVDSDELGAVAFGGPDPDWEANEETRACNKNRMQMYYGILHHTIGAYLAVAKPPRSGIFAATYASPASWSFLRQAVEPQVQAGDVALKVIWCKPYEGDDTEETVLRLQRQRVKTGYQGGAASVQEYFNMKRRFVPPPDDLNACQVETWFKHNHQECAELALDHILKTD